MPRLRSVNNKSFNKLRKESSVYQPNAVDKEFSHQVTDVVERHSTEQAGRKKKKKSQEKVKSKAEKKAKSVLRRPARHPCLGLWLDTTRPFCRRTDRWWIRVQDVAFCTQAPLTSFKTHHVLETSVPGTSDVRITATPKAPHLKLTSSSTLSGCWKPSMHPLRSGYKGNFKSTLLKMDPAEVQKWKNN